MKKITLITQSFYPERGACPERLMALASGLKARGMDIDVVTALPNYPFGRIYKGYRGKWFVKENREGIPVRRYFIFPSNSLNIFPRLISLFSFFIGLLFSVSYLIRHKPDYILVQSPPLSVGLFGLLVSKVLGIKMILNVSDVWPLALNKIKGTKGFKLRLLEKLERKLYNSSVLCIGQSEEIAHHVSRISHTKSIVYKTGVDPLHFSSGFSPRKTSEPFKIVYAGLLGAAQGLTELCQKIDFSELGAELHIFGEGGERKKLQRYIAANPEKKIFLHGCFSHDFIREILPYHHAALVPMRKYVQGNLPSKIYEAAASGLPVLFHGAGEGADLIAKNGTGLVSEIDDFEQLKKNILILCDLSPSAMQTWREKCRGVAVEKFDRTKALDRLYTELVALDGGVRIEEASVTAQPEPWKIYSLRPKKSPW